MSQWPLLSQYPDFSIADETLELCKELAKGDEFKNLKSERILSELEGSLTSTRPSFFFDTLQKVEALRVHFPEIKSWAHLDQITEQNPALRFAGLLQDLKFEEVLPFCKRMLVSNDWLEAAETANMVYSQLNSLTNMSSENIVELLYKIGAFRKPYLLEILHKLYGARTAVLLESYEILKGVSINDIAIGIVGKEISVEIKKERVRRLKKIRS